MYLDVLTQSPQSIGRFYLKIYNTHTRRERTRGGTLLDEKSRVFTVVLFVPILENGIVPFTNIGKGYTFPIETLKSNLEQRQSDTTSERLLILMGGDTEQIEGEVSVV